MLNPLLKEQLKEIEVKSEQTKLAATKVEKTLKDSAALLVEAKESMIIAMLKENLDVEMISIATKTPVAMVEEIRLKMK